MTKTMKDLRDELAKELSQVCFCSGTTCSGCEKNTERIFSHGFDACFKILKNQNKPLVEAIEYYIQKTKELDVETKAHEEATESLHKLRRMFMWEN